MAEPLGIIVNRLEVSAVEGKVCFAGRCPTHPNRSCERQIVWRAQYQATRWRLSSVTRYWCNDHFPSRLRQEAKAP